MSGTVLAVQGRTKKIVTVTRVGSIALWSTGLGLVSGLACVGVRFVFRVLQSVLVRHSGLLPHAAASLSPLPRVALPVIGALLATGVLWLAQRFSASEYEGYTEAVRFGHGRIPLGSTTWRTAASAFSVATGAAIGREGSMIQFATAAASWVGARRSTHGLSLARKVACGVAAAVAAAYQAPVAAVFFALEIVLQEWRWPYLPELALASAAGWVVSRAFLGSGPLFAVPGHLSFASIAWTLPLTVLLALLGPAYHMLLRSLDGVRKLPLALLWGGVAVGVLSLAQPAVWGNGDVGLLTTLTGTPVLVSVLGLLVLRLAATTVCVGAGTVGGVFTPTLFTGAALGLACAQLLHVSEPVLLAVVGLSVFLAAVTHAPWMASFMAVELTGQWHLLPLLFVLNLAASFLAHRLSPHSLYEIATPSPTTP